MLGFQHVIWGETTQHKAGKDQQTVRSQGMQRLSCHYWTLKKYFKLDCQVSELDCYSVCILEGELEAVQVNNLWRFQNYEKQKNIIAWGNHRAIVSFRRIKEENEEQENKTTNRASLTFKYKVFPGGSDGKESTCDAGDLGSIPEPGRCPGGGNGNPFQYSCFENFIERNLESYGLLGCKELDKIEWLTLLLSLHLSTREATKMTSDGRKFDQKETWREILLQELKERKEVPIKLRRYFTLDLGFLLRKAECDIMCLPWKSEDCVYELRLVEKSLK